MEDKGELIDALSEFVRRKSVSLNSVVCTVKSYDAPTKTYYCEPIGDYADLQQVKIIADSTKDGFLIMPKIGSIITVGLTNDNSGYMAQPSSVDEIHLAGVNYGGLAKTTALTTKYNNLETRVNLLVTDLTALATAMNTIGSTPVTGTALGAAITTAISNALTPLTLTTQADISSTEVFHGDGL